MQDSYKDAAAVEAKYKGEGTAEYYRNQVVTVPPAQLFQGTMRASQSKGRIRVKTAGLRPRIMVNNEGAPSIGGIAHTN